MKAALEAWGARSNLFHQGFAKEADDPKVIAATMAKPGIVLKRPVGTKETFRENAHLPTNLPATAPRSRQKQPPKTHKKSPSSKIEHKKAREAALRYEKEERERQRARQKEEVAQGKQRARRQHAVDKAEAALDDAKRDHEARVAVLDDQRAAIDKRAQAEDDRWRAARETLQASLKKAGS